MKKTFVSGAVATLLLAGCGGSAGTPQRVTEARQALLYASQLMRTGKVSPDVFRPSALLGVQVALFLAKTAESSVMTALKGVEIQQALMVKGREHVDETFQLLSALSDALEVNVADMLNRSADRQESLDAYVTALQAYFDKAKEQATVLAQEQQQNEADARAKRTAANNISRDLTKARNNNDYATISQKQQESIAAQSDLAAADAKVKEVRTTVGVLNELVDVASERLAAIAENRELLIAGLKVVDMPGIEDLGIIIEKNSKRSTNGNVFGAPL